MTTARMFPDFGRALRDPRSLWTLAAIVVSGAVGLALVALSSNSTWDAVSAFWDGTCGSAYAVGSSINRAVAFALVGLGYILANRANLTNVGGEGQIAVGGMLATAAALNPGIGGLPAGLAVLLPLLSGTAAGSVWGALAGWFKVRRGTNEVISTLLLTFVGLLLVYGAVQSEALLRQPMTSSATLPESLEIPDSTKLPLLFAASSSPLHLGAPLTLAALGLGWIVLARSRFGFHLKAVGHNPLAARRAGIRDGRVVIVALAVAGALGGLAGALMIQGQQYSLTSGFSSGFGFDGLVVGLLARGSPLGVLLGALCFGFLRSGGIAMEIAAGVPAAVVLIIEGLLVVTIAAASQLASRQEGAS